MGSKRSREGEILIDHSAGPGVTPEFVAHAAPGAPIVPAGKVYESAILTCGHCQAVVVLNPQRTRERGWCSSCDRYLCDGCEYARHVTLECRVIDRALDEAQEQAERGSSGLLLRKG